VLIGGALIMVITAIVVSFYTLNSETKTRCRDVELAALTYLLVFTCLPNIQILTAILLPKSRQEDKFGQGSSRSQVLIVFTSGCLCVLIAGFKAGVNWSPPRPATDAPWYDSKACLFIFNFALEILILCLLTFTRIDKRFWIPNGATREGDYSRLGERTPVALELENSGSEGKFEAKFEDRV
jgi:hypothetical protein